MDDLENFSTGVFDSDIERKFVADSNEVIEFKLVRSVDDIENEESSFQPEMSHQIFGKTEKIFGYNDLNVKIFYTAGWLRTFVKMTYHEKIDPSVIGMPADNLMEFISNFLNHDYFENLDLFVNSIREESTFKPSGVLVDSITVNGSNNSTKQFEIYHLHLSNTDLKHFNGYYQRLQRFLIWYIDGASYVDVDDERWNYFIVYEKYLNENQEYCYGVAAFSTVYEYYAYPSHIRPRISQMLVLPPFQKQGLAVYLINAIYKKYVIDKDVVDITIEDPTDSCQAVRDFVDLCRCEKLNCFSGDKLKNGFSKEMEDELRIKLKIHKKQARRLYEILLLKSINKADDEQYKNYRLFVKKRLNAPFQKLGSTMRRMNTTFKPDEVQQASVFQKPEIRMESLTRLYNELEDQYERVIKRYENSNVRPLCF